LDIIKKVAIEKKYALG